LAGSKPTPNRHMMAAREREPFSPWMLPPCVAATPMVGKKDNAIASDVKTERSDLIAAPLSFCQK